MALSSVLLAHPASGQVLQGYVVDDSTRMAIGGATVTVLLGDETVGGAIADRDGWFFFALPGAGTYQLDAQRLGYARTRSRALLLAVSDTVTVELHLRTEAIMLEPLVVTAGRGRGLSRFYARMEDWGRGIFMTPEMIDSISPRHPADVFRNQDKTWLSWEQGRRQLVPRIRTFLGTGCVAYVLDGRKINAGFWGGRLWENSPLAWISGRDLVAVEFYRYVGEAPPELRRFAAEADRPCGLAVFWTAVGW